MFSAFNVHLLLACFLLSIFPAASSQTLAERLESEVQLESFSVDTFPTVHVTGANLIIRHKGRRDVPPLIVVKEFTLDGGLIGLARRPRRFRTVSLAGLQINIPPGFKKDADSNQPVPRTDDREGGPAAIVVDSLSAVDAALTLIPKRPGKEPRVFAIHRLTMKPIGGSSRRCAAWLLMYETLGVSSVDVR